jgi:hypothetical protein
LNLHQGYWPWVAARSEGGAILALLSAALAQEIIALVYQRARDLGVALGAPVAPPPAPGDPPAPLQRDLELLIGVANGEYRRTEETVRQVEHALTRVRDLLTGNALQHPVPIAPAFWATDAGIRLSRARWWISVDELITISNAAALAFGHNTQANRMRIARAMDNGLLDWVPDPSVANPQQNKRVLRSQVERLRDLSRLPDAD